ncbi:hypothetical protein [Novosphingobium sp.]|uniref:hypothetical protein n=1 Tax=Novosphingobium sp. TaxID=1874826 RepID=UPI0031D4BD93
MNESLDPSGHEPFDPAEERRRIIAGRNRALGLTLLACVVLFFAITIVKMKL